MVSSQAFIFHILFGALTFASTTKALVASLNDYTQQIPEKQQIKQESTFCK